MAAEKDILTAVDDIENFIINEAEIGTKIIFTITDDWDENNNLPVIDVSIQDSDTLELFGDLNFETFREALIAIAKNYS